MFRFFSRSKIEESKIDDINLNAVELMISIALADGKMSEDEKKLIMHYIDSRNIDSKSKLFKDALDSSIEMTSFHDQVTAINESYAKEDKISLLNDIWKLILIDGVIDKYEENLFYRIGDLIHIKRTELNKIKNT